MRLVHFAEIERPVPPIEDALHVIRIEKKSVLLPTEIRQRRIRPKVAVQESWFAVRKVDFPGCINHLRFVYKSDEVNRRSGGFINGFVVQQTRRFSHCTLRKAEALCWSPFSPVTTHVYSPRSPMAAVFIVNVPSLPMDARLLRS